MTIDVEHRGVHIVTESDLTEFIDRCLAAEELRDRLQEALRVLQEKYDRLSKAYTDQQSFDLSRDTDGFGGHR